MHIQGLFPILSQKPVLKGEKIEKYFKFNPTVQWPDTKFPKKYINSSIECENKQTTDKRGIHFFPTTKVTMTPSINNKRKEIIFALGKEIKLSPGQYKMIQFDYRILAPPEIHIVMETNKENIIAEYKRNNYI